MQIIATMLNDSVVRGNLNKNNIPVDVNLDNLIEASNTISQLTSEGLNTNQQAKKDIAQINERLNISKTTQQETQETLIGLKKAYETTLQSQKWAEELKDLTNKELVERFVTNDQKLQAQQLLQQEQHGNLQQSKAMLEGIQQKLDILKDPLIRLAEEDNLEQKQTILEALYKIAELNLVQEESTINLEIVDQNEAHSLSAMNQTAPEFSAEEYQNLLATRSRIIKEQQSHRQELLASLNNLGEQMNEYTLVLSKTRELLLQHRALAVELKILLGSNQLSNDDVPNGITEALRPALIGQLETNISKLSREQVEIREQINRLGQQDETLEEIQISLSKIVGLFSAQLDTLKTLADLEKDFELEFIELPETERQSLKQAATRRLNSENTRIDAFLRLIPSEDAHNLTGVLQNYYVELMVVENKKENLQRQRENTNRLIELTEEERITISKLLDLLQKQKEQIVSEDEMAWLEIRAQLMPEQATELLDNYEATTGRYLAPPSPILEEK